MDNISPHVMYTRGYSTENWRIYIRLEESIPWDSTREKWPGTKRWSKEVFFRCCLFISEASVSKPLFLINSWIEFGYIGGRRAWNCSGLDGPGWDVPSRMLMFQSKGEVNAYICKQGSNRGRMIVFARSIKRAIGDIVSRVALIRLTAVGRRDLKGQDFL